jgi:hypothetical protein
MFTQFYNKSLRKLVVGFGSLFNNLYVSHANPDNIASPLNIRVPITYAPQEKFIRRLLEPSSINDNTRIENQLPRMSYIMTTVTPDPSRRRSKFSPITTREQDGMGDCTGTVNIINEQVPVNVGFSLFIYTRHIDDTLQIVEQIIPYFNPDHIIELDLNEAQTNVKIPLTMVSNNITERYDGDFGTRRVNISSMTFVAKSYIYGKVETGVSTILAPGGITIGVQLNNE